MFDFLYFPDRTFALGVGIYVGPWGVHIYLDFWKWCLSFESKPKKLQIETLPATNITENSARIWGRVESIRESKERPKKKAIND